MLDLVDNTDRHPRLIHTEQETELGVELRATDLQDGAAEGDVEEVLHRGTQGGAPRHHKPHPSTKGCFHCLQDCAVDDRAQLHQEHKGFWPQHVQQ